jgi:hypothetical protein
VAWSEAVVRSGLSGLVLCLSALQAGAVTVGPCNDLATVLSIAEPWEANTRTFASGEVRLVVLDTIEPAAGSFHLVILHPPRDELGGPVCTQVSATEGIGFGAMDLGLATAGYDPARGLTVALPVNLYNADTAFFDAGTLVVTINQSTGEVQAVVQ